MLKCKRDGHWFELQSGKWTFIFCSGNQIKRGVELDYSMSQKLRAVRGKRSFLTEGALQVMNNNLDSKR